MVAGTRRKVLKQGGRAVRMRTTEEETNSRARRRKKKRRRRRRRRRRWKKLLPFVLFPPHCQEKRRQSVRE
jgi:hypothetical protein